MRSSGCGQEAVYCIKEEPEPQEQKLCGHMRGRGAWSVLSNNQIGISRLRCLRTLPALLTDSPSFLTMDQWIWGPAWRAQGPLFLWA